MSIEDERLACMNRLQSIHRGLGGFASWYGGFPEPTIKDNEGTEWFSWRFEIFSGIHFGLMVPEDKQPQAPWREAPNEYSYWEEKHEVERFRARDSRQDWKRAIGRTDFFVLIGPGTAYSENTTTDYVSHEIEDRLLHIESDAILLLECNQDLHWIEPGDVRIEDIVDSKSQTGLGDFRGNFPGCFAVCFVDGTVWFLSDSIPKTEILKFMTVESAKKNDRDEVLGEYVIQRLMPREALDSLRKSR